MVVWAMDFILTEEQMAPEVQVATWLDEKILKFILFRVEITEELWLAAREEKVLQPLVQETVPEVPSITCISVAVNLDVLVLLLMGAEFQVAAIAILATGELVSLTWNTLTLAAQLSVEEREYLAQALQAGVEVLLK